MPQTLPDVTLGDTWVDINTVTSVAVGAEMSIINKGSQDILLYEGSTAPSATTEDGIPLTYFGGNYATATIVSGSLRIWGKSRVSGSEAKITVQPA